MLEIRGIIVPLITPFTDAGEVNEDVLRSLVEDLIEGGVHGLAPAGSTGEAISLSEKEWTTLVATVVNQAAGRVPVFAGCSANATRAVISNCRRAGELGADGIMITHPYYALPDERELFAHYEAVSDNVDLPVIVYNNPVTTGVDASPELLARITRLPHLNAIKESSGDCTRVMRLRLLVDPGVALLSGSDNQALEHLIGGAVGWVAGAANVIPSQCVELFDLVDQQDFTEAIALYRALYPYLSLAELTGKFVQVNKTGLELRGLDAGAPREPLLPLTTEEREDVRKALDGVLDFATPA